jgi:hypothetical protein
MRRFNVVALSTQRTSSLSLLFSPCVRFRRHVRWFSSDDEVYQRLSLWGDQAHKLEPLTHCCRGCGWELQTVDSTALGYIPPVKLEPPTPGPEDIEVAPALDGRHLLCKRCWRIEHHNEVSMGEVMMLCW